MKNLYLVFLSASVILSGCGSDNNASENEANDKTAPVITLNGAPSITLEYGSSYDELGATATDAVDGTVNVDISSALDVSTLGTYTITYSASDSSGNTTTTTREINVVDTTAPVLNLEGSNTVELLATEIYQDQGATAIDNYDGDITVNVSSTEGSPHKSASA